jgi:hypothetical protein
MGRYLKYLEIVNKIDSAMDKLVSGKVDINKDLPKIQSLLEVQKNALCMAMQIDHIDDAVKSTAKLFAMGDPSAQEVMKGVMKHMQMQGMGGHGHSQQGAEMARMGGNPHGKDFRGGRENTGAELGLEDRYPARFRTATGGVDEMMDDEGGVMFPYPLFEAEENRRRRRYGRRRYRAEMDEMDAMNDAMHDMDDMERDAMEREESRRRYRRGYRTRSEHNPVWPHHGYEHEESRRGRSRRTGRFVHRADMMDDGGMYPEHNFWYLPGAGVVPSFYNRMGFGADPHEHNRPYSGIQVPLQNAMHDGYRHDGHPMHEGESGNIDLPLVHDAQRTGTATTTPGVHHGTGQGSVNK